MTALRPSRIAIAALCAMCTLCPLDAQQPRAIQLDATGERKNPASMQTFQIPSHGALLNAFIYVAAGARPHPAVVLLHGFPGNERNRLVGLSGRLLVLSWHRRHSSNHCLPAAARNDKAAAACRLSPAARQKGSPVRPSPTQPRAVSWPESTPSKAGPPSLLPLTMASRLETLRLPLRCTMRGMIE
jgi:hypothetical protein